MRRFYKDVRVGPRAHGHVLFLDEKEMKSPAGTDFILPTLALADVIAGEWAAQEKEIAPHTMPFMKFAATAVDHIPKIRKNVVERLVAYLDCDLVRIRVDEPRTLARNQTHLWNPPLNWFNRCYGLQLSASTALVAPATEAAEKQAMEKRIDALNDWEMIGLQSATLAAGSLVLGLALYEKEMTGEDVFKAAELETTHQIEVWGEDAELTRRRQHILEEIQASERWLILID